MIGAISVYTVRGNHRPKLKIQERLEYPGKVVFTTYDARDYITKNNKFYR